MTVITFRLFSIFGPWEESTRLIPTLIRRARKDLNLKMASPETARDFLYIEDALDALLHINQFSNLNGKVINLGSGTQTTLKEVVSTILNLLESNSIVNWNAYPPRKWDSPSWLADISQIRDLLGWQPSRSLIQGMAEMASWMNNYGDKFGPNQLD